MESRTGLQISTRAFIQSLVILFVLMMVAGLLTRIVPAGMYDRIQLDGREVIDPTSYRVTGRPDYPIWRWFTAPIEVLGAPGNLTVIVIIIFILFIGGSFAVLDRSGIVRAAIGRIVRRFGQEKYALLLVISLFFMALGAFFGIFEEVVPLVPVMVALSYSLGWDALVGLGMSVLATNLGFSAAVTNPFTIGVAQKLAQLPLFSGWWLRVPVFLIVYALFAVFLTTYARKIERDPTRSPVYQEDQTEREKYRAIQAGLGEAPPRVGRALAWFGLFTLLILAVLFVGPFVPAISDYTLPAVGLLFLIAGVGAGLLSGAGGKTVGRAAGGLEGYRGQHSPDPHGRQHPPHRRPGRHSGHNPPLGIPALQSGQPLRRRPRHVRPDPDPGVFRPLRVGQGLPDDARPPATGRTPGRYPPDDRHGLLLRRRLLQYDVSHQRRPAHLAGADLRQLPQMDPVVVAALAVGDSGDGRLYGGSGGYPLRAVLTNDHKGLTKDTGELFFAPSRPLWY